ncbi:hypothetical protein CDIK_2190 [Cucumispora dikerogammari]|nr:hypothetical protein CDIK_2190 [Cucumispora dikerogammari]
MSTFKTFFQAIKLSINYIFTTTQTNESRTITRGIIKTDNLITSNNLNDLNRIENPDFVKLNNFKLKANKTANSFIFPTLELRYENGREIGLEALSFLDANCLQLKKNLIQFEKPVYYGSLCFEYNYKMILIPFKSTGVFVFNNTIAGNTLYFFMLVTLCDNQSFTIEKNQLHIMGYKVTNFSFIFQVSDVYSSVLFKTEEGEKTTTYAFEFPADFINLQFGFRIKSNNKIETYDTNVSDQHIVVKETNHICNEYYIASNKTQGDIMNRSYISEEQLTVNDELGRENKESLEEKQPQHNSLNQVGSGEQVENSSSQTRLLETKKKKNTLEQKPSRKRRKKTRKNTLSAEKNTGKEFKRDNKVKCIIEDEVKTRHMECESVVAVERNEYKENLTKNEDGQQATKDVNDEEDFYKHIINEQHRKNINEEQPAKNEEEKQTTRSVNKSNFSVFENEKHSTKNEKRVQINQVEKQLQKNKNEEQPALNVIERKKQLSEKEVQKQLQQNENKKQNTKDENKQNLLENKTEGKSRRKKQMKELTEIRVKDERGQDIYKDHSVVDICKKVLAQDGCEKEFKAKVDEVLSLKNPVENKTTREKWTYNSVDNIDEESIDIKLNILQGGDLIENNTIKTFTQSSDNNTTNKMSRAQKEEIELDNQKIFFEAQAKQNDSHFGEHSNKLKADKKNANDLYEKYNRQVEIITTDDGGLTNSIEVKYHNLPIETERNEDVKNKPLKYFLKNETKIGTEKRAEKLKKGLQRSNQGSLSVSDESAEERHIKSRRKTIKDLELQSQLKNLSEQEKVKIQSQQKQLVKQPKSIRPVNNIGADKYLESRLSENYNESNEKLHGGNIETKENKGEIIEAKIHNLQEKTELPFVEKKLLIKDVAKKNNLNETTIRREEQGGLNKRRFSKRQLFLFILLFLLLVVTSVVVASFLYLFR